MPACQVCSRESSTRCGRCQHVFYCGKDHQAQNWKDHKLVCRPPDAATSQSTNKTGTSTGAKIKGVRIQRMPGRMWEEVDIDENDPIWTEGVSCPVPSGFGMPLIVQRDIRQHPFSIPRSADLDNQPVTYLMIDSYTGFAPPEWQFNIGPVTIARRDKKPLLLVHMEAIHEFMSRLLDEFGETGEAGSVPAWRMS
jgi:hypothetical protein